MTWKHAIVIGVVAGIVISVLFFGFIFLCEPCNPILTPFTDMRLK